MTTFTTTKPKNLETSRGVAWTAKLYADGQHAADVENRGDGGQDFYYWHDRNVMVEFANQAEAYNKANPDSVGFGAEKLCKFNGQPDPDFCAGFIEHLMQKAELAARLAKDCKTMICLRLPGQSEDEYSMAKKLAPTPANIARVKAQYPEATILNPGA